MQRQTVINTLKAHRSQLAGFGVSSLTLFGSVARDEATADSDVDVLAEFDRPVGFFGMIQVQDYLTALLGRKVDLGTWKGLKPSVRTTVLAEAVHVD